MIIYVLYYLCNNLLLLLLHIITILQFTVGPVRWRFQQDQMSNGQNPNSPAGLIPNILGTWRIIPLSNWLITPVSKSPK